MKEEKATYIGRESQIEIAVGRNVNVPEGTPVRPAAAGDYLVGLINITDSTFVMACYNYTAGGNNNWFPIPATPRTCSSDCNSCYASQSWSIILTTNCNNPAFKLSIATKPDNAGNSKGATFDIKPNCNAPGGIICII